MSVWATFLLVIAIWQNSVSLLLLFLIMLPSELPKIPRPYLWEGLLFCGNFFFITPSLGWLSFPDLLPLFSSLSFVLLHFKEIGLSFWVSGVFCQNSKVVFLFCFVFFCFVCLFVFCRSCFTWRWSFDVFVREKMISPSHSSAILRQPLVCVFDVKLYEKFIYAGY